MYTIIFITRPKRKVYIHLSMYVSICPHLWDALNKLPQGHIAIKRWNLWKQNWDNEVASESISRTDILRIWIFRTKGNIGDLDFYSIHLTKLTLTHKIARFLFIPTFFYNFNKPYISTFLKCCYFVLSRTFRFQISSGHVLYNSV